MDKMIRVVIVDDHPAVRDGLKALVRAQGDMTVSAEASNGEDALSCVRALRPAIVLMDVSMPGWSGVMTTRTVMAAFPDTKIIAVSRSDDPGVVDGMLTAGATGYVLKRNAARDLTDAIRAAVAGKAIRPPAIDRTPASTAAAARREAGHQTAGRPLTACEERVLLLVARASSNEQIAHALSITSDAATALKTQAMRKARLTSRVQVVGYAQRRGWLD